jgi:hypothetical protein
MSMPMPLLGLLRHLMRSQTTELLSCARTALKIARAQNPPRRCRSGLIIIDPSLLELHSDKRDAVHYPQIGILSEDGLALLRAMQVSLEKLQGLVKQRGNVNDPTHEIASCTRQLETDAKELTVIVAAARKPFSIHKSAASKTYLLHCRMVAIPWPRSKLPN